MEKRGITRKFSTVEAPSNANIGDGFANGNAGIRRCVSQVR